jgi:hypothetical protein
MSLRPRSLQDGGELLDERGDRERIRLHGCVVPSIVGWSLSPPCFGDDPLQRLQREVLRCR